MRESPGYGSVEEILAHKSPSEVSKGILSRNLTNCSSRMAPVCHSGNDPQAPCSLGFCLNPKPVTLSRAEGGGNSYPRAPNPGHSHELEFRV